MNENNNLNDAYSDVPPPLNEIEIIEHVWITMSDGIRLSAKMWLPDNARENPVPAILEMIPYRKRDVCAMRDHHNHAWLAARGYCCIRPDMRGHGDSEGIMLDEYSPREQQDTIEVIEWLSQQIWCDGNVGMMGLSWGGIASMQTAVLQPSNLKAIIPVGASTDRYYDDGGYLVGGYPGQGLGWGGIMFGYCIRPPDPEIVGEAWRDMWLKRLKNTPMFAEKWLNHQLRDETWKQGSVCENYDKINIPVLGVSGWNDCWPNTVIRLLDNVKSPCRAVSGAWGHVFPNLGGPGPMIGFLQLALKWWDYWLKGINNEIIDLPDFIAFMQKSHSPDPKPNSRPGKWIGIPNWQNNHINTQSFGLKDNKLINEQGEGSISICSPLTVGLATGEYMPIHGIAELAQDQSEDDANSVCFDSEILNETLDILGTTNLHLRLSCDSSCGLIAARLCDVSPNGSSTLISYGILNLKQRNGREILSKINIGEDMDVTVRLNDTGWTVEKGHKIRLALSSQLWPMAWPTEKLATLKLKLAHCRLEIPILKTQTCQEIDSPFAPPVAAENIPHKIISNPLDSRHIYKNIETNETVFDVKYDRGKILLEKIGLTYGTNNSQRYSITKGDPLSARIEYNALFTFAREKWKVSTKSKLTVTCDEQNFILKGKISAFEDEKQVFTRDWNVKIPRVVF